MAVRVWLKNSWLLSTGNSVNDKLRILVTLLTLLGSVCSNASELPASKGREDDSQAELRENPDIDLGTASESELPTHRTGLYTPYPYLDLKANSIAYNGADWSRLRSLFSAAGDTLINILHIGDSHIQAEGATSRTRALLQDRYGSAGRGLVIPFRLAGTNQPVDFSITSPSRFVTAKLMKQPWSVDMGFSGIALRPLDRNFSITISARSSGGIEPDFDRIRIFCSGILPEVTMAKGSYGAINFEQVRENGYIDLFLEDTQSSVTLNFTSEGTCSILAFDLDNSMTGVKYSAIGNNGATYSSYNAIGSLGRDIRTFNPDLVIVSLGANEAFGKVSDAAMRASIDLMVKNIRKANPNAAILLTTPSECQRSIRTRKRIRKRRYRTIRTYRINENIDRLRRVILEYGRANNIATYDWYAVAGGAGSSSKWLADRLMSTDRIHLTHKGYVLMGDLFFDALVK